MYKFLAKSLFLGKKVVYMPSCHSTSSYAADLLSKPDTIEGTVVITDDQTQGRGQRGNHWEAEAGKNLTLSLILYPRFLAIRDQFWLNIAVSLAVNDFLQALAPDHGILIKWPNDVLAGNRKMAGMLIENRLKGSFLESSVVGIGLNVNQTKFQVAGATSLHLLTGRSFDLPELFDQLILAIERRYLELKSGNFHSLKSDYLQYLYGFRLELPYYSEHKFLASIEDVTSEGKLVVRRKGRLYSYDFKEIRFLLE